MRHSFRVILAAVLMAPSVPWVQAGEDISKAPPPAWVEAVDLPSADSNAEKASNDGVIHLLADIQRNRPDETVFEHYARKFISQSGVQENARIAFEFEPSYQTLTLHQLRLHRNGEVIDRLPTAKIRLLKRESELRQHLYNGQVSAVIDVEDIRVGDTLEYAFSTHGENPVFNGVYSEFLMTSWNSPVSRFSFRLLEPTAQYLKFETRGTPLKYSEKTVGDLTERRWTADNIPAAETDGDTPYWYSPYGWIQLSEYRNWAEVEAWASAFYSLDSPLPPEVETKLQTLRELTSPEEQILGALNYVQNEIRYLSVSEGVHSYRPYPIAEVIQRGFGDCKDKARLLSAMLQALGFTAHPALVHTDYRREIGSWLPSPLDFDHVIVALKWNDRTHWLDPTRDHQRGQLGERYSPAYGKALVIRPGETQLTDVTPAGESRAVIRIESIYEIPAYDQEANLKIQADYQGREADWMRQTLSGTSIAQLQKDYLNDAARLHPGVRVHQDLSFADDPEKNQIRSEETYRIPKLWQPDSEDPSMLYAEMYPTTVSAQVTLPQTRIRHSPLAVNHPKTVRETFIVKLPEKGDFRRESVEVKDPAFEFSYRVRPTNRTLTIEYDYRSLTDSVPAERVGEYLENLKKVRDQLGYSISLPRSRTTGEADTSDLAVWLEGWNWLLIALTLALFLVIFFAGIVVYFWRPQWPPQPAHPNRCGLQGWLILVAIGLFTSPIMILIHLGNFLPLFQIKNWNQFTGPEGEYYHPLWMPALLGEFIILLSLLAFSLLLIVFFFQRRRTFPPLYIAMLSLGVIFTVLDTLLVLPLDAKFPSLELDSGWRDAAQAILHAAIWIPYLRISERVKATFVK